MLTERRPEANGGGEASLRWINNFLGETAYREFDSLSANLQHVLH